METWTDEEVFQWLQETCKIPQELAQTFKMQKIDGAALIELTQDELRGPPFGLTIGDVKRVIRHVRTFQNPTGQVFVVSVLVQGLCSLPYLWACVAVCVWACTRRMLTVIGARQCMRVLVCVFLCTRRMVTVIAARRCMRVLVLCVVVHKAHGHCDCCEAMHACACLFVLVHKGAWSL
jgi:hypothetical protein